MKNALKLSMLSAALSLVVAACGPAPEPGPNDGPDPTLGPDTTMADTMMFPPDTPTVR